MFLDLFFRTIAVGLSESPISNRSSSKNFMALALIDTAEFLNNSVQRLFSELVLQ